MTTAKTSAGAAATAASTASPSTASTTTPTFIVGRDGSGAADRALEFSASRARNRHGRVHVVCGLKQLPFGFLLQEALAERSMVRKTETDQPLPCGA